ncbi:MAG: zinc metallopeptidase [Anaerolineae bacterium]|nr:zinc metallopeptidase [Anaerolineae bacterium]
MYWPMFNPMYYLFALPALLLGLYAQYKVQAAYSKYQRIPNRRGIPGYEVARKLLAVNGLYHVGVKETPGQLSDHYDPRSKTLYLSAGVSRSPSVASLGIVAHEVGHAVQDQVGYMPLRLRSGLVPAVQIGSWLGPIIFLLGMVLPIPKLSLFGLLLFSATLIFALVTLPVELDASRRAIMMLEQSGLVTLEEKKGAEEVLSAAALTYVAAVAQALSTILYYIFLLGGFRRRD